MSDEPEQSQPVKPDDVEEPTELFEWFNKVQDVLKFWKTRDAILGGEPVYEYDRRQLSESGYLGPWHFNLTQSTLSGLPALLIPLILRILHLSKTTPAQDDLLDEILQLFGIPFILMLTAYVVGRASLWKRDATKAAKRHAAHVFLYLDGAYGFYPQLAATAVFSLALAASDASDLQAVLRFASWVGIWQLIVSMKTIPNELFWALGYSSHPDRKSITLFQEGAFRPAKPVVAKEGDPPKWKYRLCVLFVLPMIVIAFLVLVSLLSLALHLVFRFIAG